MLLLGHMYRLQILPKSLHSCMINRSVSFTSNLNNKKKYNVLVVGGGTGGVSTSSVLARKLGKGNVAVIEPSDTHYYQPLWTLIGGGVKSMAQSARPMGSCLSKKVDWIKNSVVAYNPDSNEVTLDNGDVIGYNYLIAASGFQLRFDMIKGAEEALRNDPRVCSNYHIDYVLKTFPAIENLSSGDAIFTQPLAPIKCAGAPQKIMYIADWWFRKMGKRDQVKIYLNSAAPSIFAVPKYGAVLKKIAEGKDCELNFLHNLVEVIPEKSEAIFERVEGEKKEKISFKYDLLHIVPPMTTHDVLRKSDIVNEAGFVDVDKHTLQHVRYPNIFSIGDCSSLPTSKTAAAAATQSGILTRNLLDVMAGRSPSSAPYTGYTSCPLITDVGHCVLAEFDYDLLPLETFPINQAVPRRTMYFVKAHALPQVYYNLLLTGRWSGPSSLRKFFRPFSRT